MKQLLSIFIAVLVAITAFGQSSPTNKLRSNDSFTQVDNYLVAAKRLGIPSGPSLTLDGSTSSADAPKLFWRTSDSTLHVYVPALSSWLPAGGGQEGGGTWGTISGTLSDQTDLQNALDSKLDTAAHGFGLGWNNTTQKMEWGEEIAAGYRGVFLPDNNVLFIGKMGGFMANIGALTANASANGGLGLTAPVTGSVTHGFTFFNAPSGGYTTSEPPVRFFDALGLGGLHYAGDYSANFTDRSLVDKAYVDNQNAFNVEDVTQLLYTDKAINVRAFNNTGMDYQEGSIDFGITRDSTHTMGPYAFKQGIETAASGYYSSAFGGLTTASGPASSAFGNGTTASGEYSSAFGNGTTASGPASSAFGVLTTASGAYSSAFGGQTTASGDYSSAFGGETTASGNYSSAFGQVTTASGFASSAFGQVTTASGYYSSAFGLGNAANEYASLAIGQYSTDGAVETSWTAGSPIFKVGNGVNDTNRSNAYVLYNDGRSEQVKDVEVTEIGQGFVLKSPDGTRWRITVDNSGNLGTEEL